jgi:hypothetical protein
LTLPAPHFVHFLIQSFDCGTAGARANERKKTVEETCRARPDQSGCKPEGHAHMLKVTFADRRWMIAEWISHETALAGGGMRGRKA